MTLTITLTPEEESRIRREAAAAGLGVDDYAGRLIRNSLPTPAPGARVSARGKYAHSGRTADDFLQERRQENQREETNWDERYGTPRP